MPRGNIYLGREFDIELLKKGAPCLPVKKFLESFFKKIYRHSFPGKRAALENVTTLLMSNIVRNALFSFSKE
jgi:hypothetical protein